MLLCSRRTPGSPHPSKAGPSAPCSKTAMSSLPTPPALHRRRPRRHQSQAHHPRHGRRRQDPRRHRIRLETRRLPRPPLPPEALNRNLAALCRPLVLNLPEQNEKEQAALRRLKLHSSWSLNIDNVYTDEAADETKALPAKLTTSHVLIGDWTGHIKSFSLDVRNEAAFLDERSLTARLLSFGSNCQTPVQLVFSKIDPLCSTLLLNRWPRHKEKIPWLGCHIACIFPLTLQNNIPCLQLK